MEVPYKTKNRATTYFVQPCNLTPGYMSEKNKIRKDTCTPMFIAALFTIARTWKQPKCPSTEERLMNIGPHGDFLGHPVVKNLPGNAGELRSHTGLN